MSPIRMSKLKSAVRVALEFIKQRLNQNLCHELHEFARILNKSAKISEIRD